MTSEKMTDAELVVDMQRNALAMAAMGGGVMIISREVYERVRNMPLLLPHGVTIEVCTLDANIAGAGQDFETIGGMQ